MRRWFDKKVGTRADVDNVDGLPKFQVNLEERKLREVVGHDADRLLALPAVLFGLARPPALDSAFIRHTRDTPAHMPFHVDGNSFTGEHCSHRRRTKGATWSLGPRARATNAAPPRRLTVHGGPPPAVAGDRGQRHRLVFFDDVANDPRRAARDPPLVPQTPAGPGPGWSARQPGTSAGQTGRI